jgi:hypothetical protein
LNAVICFKIENTRNKFDEHSAARLERESVYVRLWSVVMGTKGLLLFTLLVSCCYLRILDSAPSIQGTAAVLENVIFEHGTCRDCDKILLRDTVIRCAPRNNGSHVSTILSYDGVRYLRDEEITYVKITDRSEEGDGAGVEIKSGNIEQPFIKLNITSRQGKGYHLSVEIRGIDPSKPDCDSLTISSCSVP